MREEGGREGGSEGVREEGGSEGVRERGRGSFLILIMMQTSG